MPDYDCQCRTFSSWSENKLERGIWRWHVYSLMDSSVAQTMHPIMPAAKSLWTGQKPLPSLALKVGQFTMITQRFAQNGISSSVRRMICAGTNVAPANGEHQGASMTDMSHHFSDKLDCCYPVQLWESIRWPSGEKLFEHARGLRQRNLVYSVSAESLKCTTWWGHKKKNAKAAWRTLTMFYTTLLLFISCRRIFNHEHDNGKIK